MGYSAQRERIRGDLAAAAALYEESAEIARKIGWQWWESHERGNVAELARLRGELELAEAAALRMLALALDLGDRMVAVFATAELASVAALRSDVVSAGRLWGAIEREESNGPIGQWPGERPGYEKTIVPAADTDFDRARREGSLLTLAEAAGVEPAQTEP